MRHSINIDSNGLNLKEALEDYVSGNGYYCEFPVRFGWGIDYAYCGVMIPGRKYNDALFIATDNHDGTIMIEETDNAHKYLKQNAVVNA